MRERVRENRRQIRAIAVVAVLVCLLVLGVGYILGPHPSAPQTAPPADGITVVTTQPFYPHGSLYAYGPDGERLIAHDKYDFYHDVDPSPTGNRTVMFTAGELVSGPECREEDSCQHVVIAQLNLTTGETREVYDKVYDKNEKTVIWHDADRLSNGTYAIADLEREGVTVVDSSNKTIEWAWEVSQVYSGATGNPGFSDWAHTNDVEMINETTMMVSLRNQDTVAFVHREHGHLDGLKLGSDSNRSILYEQHNPDYIPEERGGPAVVVADSQNNRIVEYQRVNGSWKRSWTWQDSKMAWPRDADRLPNGHTLITDTNADRVVEVDESGEVVWEIPVKEPYDVERLGTGDESTGGHAASELGLRSRTSSGPTGPVDRVYGYFQTKEVNAFLFVTAEWFGLAESLAVMALVVVFVVWGVLEAVANSRGLRWPFYRHDD